MANLIQYRRLFTIQILHEYYLPRETALYSGLTEKQRERIFNRQEKDYDISRDFDIVPTEDCIRLLRNNNLIFKQDKFGFFVACKVEKQNENHFKPFTPFDEFLRLGFAIYLKNKNLVNFSNLRQDKNTSKKDRFIFYFSNRAENSVYPGTLYLSNPAREFDEEKDYEAGEIHMDITDPDNPEIYEAIEDNGPGAYVGKNWLRIFTDRNPLPGFVTNDDRIILRPKVFKFDVSSAEEEKLFIIIKDYNGTQVKSIVFNTIKTGEPLRTCTLELTDLASAYYTLQVLDNNSNPIEGLNLTFYLSDDLYIQKPFALVECFHFPDGRLDDYKLLNETLDNQILSPTYTIHWKNRSTFWRYYYSDPPNFISTHAEVYKLTSNQTVDNILVSNQPFGLTQFNRRLEIRIDGEDLFLPNPGSQSIFPQEGRIYSEINMGAGLGPPPLN